MVTAEGGGGVPAWAVGGGDARIPTLDGLRAVAIAGVVVSHGHGTVGFPRVSKSATHQLGFYGVDLFFAISGFLITLLLLRERDRSGRVSLRRFYIRRALRILPAYAAYLAFVAGMQGFGAADVSALDWVGALTMTSDYIPRRSWVLGHTWSLSVEEHFYMIWPWLVAGVAARRLVPALVALVAAGPFLRYATARYAPSLDLAFAAHYRIDPMAVGCLLAFASRWPGAATWRARIAARWPIVLAVSVAALAASRAVGDWRYEIVAGKPLEAACIGLILASCVLAPKSIAGRLLESRPMVGLGALSYSLYLWQQPFLDARSHAWYARWPTSLGLAVACAVASRYLVERPFLGLKDRWSRGEGRGWLHADPSIAQPAPQAS